MKSLTCFKTINNNHYIYNSQKRQSIYCHPLLVKIISKWLHNPKQLYLEKFYEEEVIYDKKTINHYYDKFNILLRSGFLTKQKIKNTGLTKIPLQEIEKNLANADHIVFEITEACNLNCNYCGYGDLYWDHDKRTNSALAERIAFKLLSYLESLWNSAKNISHNKEIMISFYGGEPLLNINFIKKIVKHFENQEYIHNQFAFGITTNGVLLHKYIDFLVEHNFYISVSLDGDNKMNRHRILRDGSSSFKKVFDNAILIKEKYPEYYNKNISFNAVLHNYNDIESIIKFFHQNLNKIPRISQLNNMGIAKEKWDSFKKIYRLSKDSIRNAVDIDFLKQKMEVDFPGNFDKTTFLHNNFDNTFWNYQELFKYHNNTSSHTRIPTGTCLPFSKKIFLTAQGKILPCERIGHQYSLGTVNENNVDLNNKTVVKLFEKYFNKIKKQCEACYHFNSCRQCIFNIESLNEDAICEAFSDENAFLNSLADFYHFFENDPLFYKNTMRNIVIRY